LTIHKLKTTEGKEFAISVPDPINRPSFFIFSLPKSGSTLLMQMVTDVCRLQKIPMVDVATEIFNRGIQPATLTRDINSIWEKQGYCYLGFRSFFPAIDFDFTQTKNILLIRDPRDMLVSLYFSIKYSHVEPAGAGPDNSIRTNRERIQNKDINQSVLGMAHSYKKYLQDYLSHLSPETTRVYRYEDVVFKKKEWLEDVLEFLNIDMSDLSIWKIANKYDIRPDKEDPHKHIRQVSPGNYKVHLSSATIEKLDELFKPVMQYFQYDSVVSMMINPEANKKAIQQKTIGTSDIDRRVIKLQNELTAMRQSFSWRVTHPLRTLFSFIKGL
jgi:sulfotransferase family protein